MKSSWGSASRISSSNKFQGKEEMVKLSRPPVLVLLLVFLAAPAASSLLGPSGAEPVVDPLRPGPQEKQRQQQEEGRGRGCSYTVTIKTSCSSRRFTRDMISLAFGDAYRNEVYVPRLDDPTTGTFERCSTDTFKIKGPCGYGICYLYLRRDGWDGWTPESVKVYEPNFSRTITFYYGIPLPNAIWYGFNHCPRSAAATSSLLSLSS